MNSKTAKGLKITGLVLAVVVLIALASLFGVFAHKSTLLAADIDAVNTVVKSYGDEKTSVEDKVKTLQSNYTQVTEELKEVNSQIAKLEESLGAAEDANADAAQKLSALGEKLEALIAEAEELEAQLDKYMAYSAALDAWIDGLLETKVGDMVKYLKENPLPHAHEFFGEDCEVCDECGAHLCDCVRGDCRTKCEGHDEVIDEDDQLVGDVNAEA